MHVLLARALTEKGISTLRFDLSGIGDSSVRTDDLPALEAPVEEVRDAISELESRGFARIVLFGICSGAVHAFKAAAGHPVVAGVILVNPGTDETGEVNPQDAANFYLRRSLWSLTAWKNLFTGKVNYRQLFTTLILALIKKFRVRNKNQAPMEGESRDPVKDLMQQGTSVLMVLSDRHAQLYKLVPQDSAELYGKQYETWLYPDTDHLFTSLSEQRDLINRICQWSHQLAVENT